MLGESDSGIEGKVLSNILDLYARFLSHIVSESLAMKTRREPQISGFRCKHPLLGSSSM